jgi:hypothetical protein
MLYNINSEVYRSYMTKKGWAKKQAAKTAAADKVRD